MLTLSHIVFLTGNWREIWRTRKIDNNLEATAQALERTRTPSLYCMATTLLGFGSLLFVSAEPLRQLGQGGLIGTVAAFLAAYILYPGFLCWERPKQNEKSSATLNWISTLRRKSAPIGVIVVCVAIVSGLGIQKLRTDPGLLAYFDAQGKIGTSLRFIDQNGGSSPLILVVAKPDGSKLHNSTAYDQLWDLQSALQGQHGVGSIVSLPLLMAEANSHPIAALLTFEWLVDILSGPKYGEVAKSFISDDRTEAVFLLRMVESDRAQKRVEIVGDLHDTVQKNGFEVTKTGGVYYLQGKLSQLVAASMIQGLGVLVILFAAIAYAITRRWRPTAALTLSLALVPLTLIGALGWGQVSIDIISAPSVNVIIGLAVDTMIHLTIAARLARDGNAYTADAWDEARTEQWSAISISVVMVSAGFSLFALSGFPPTQRFGMEIVAGTLLAGVVTFLILPWLGVEKKK